MKKKWKIALASCFVLAVGGAGAFYYSFTTKEYDISQDEKVKQIVEPEYDVRLPDDTDANGQNSGNENVGTSAANETETPNHTSETKNNTALANNETKNGASTTTNTNKQTNHQNKTEVTAASIVEKYRPSFTNLQQQANAKIDALVAHAFAEYQAKKADNEEISLSFFYSKYNTAAKELESKTDAAFETIYHALEAELKKHGFSTSYAKEFRDAYEQEKKARRNALLKKAMEKL
ncbi:hypothetical protein B0I26_1046 [Anoxybacillus vitaminiphilus]|uniref:Uncharacterized protein n=1 Tax=Paranoxybacillus vitaminiphilus TaxID=581036 RepID=A0A327YKV3_9BACL|nr:hypothetical protein [Anoxybacillus vitaminiphilus]RAK20355.1 hypothetical protein B0I26_1046 [Anoxybacillus vitaminiphilus]